jgi:hypothetical protein
MSATLQTSKDDSKRTTWACHQVVVMDLAGQALLGCSDVTQQEQQ